MDTEANKAVVRQYIEMWNTGEVGLAEAVLAPDWLDHNHPEVQGPENVKQSMLKVRSAVPNFHITIDTILGEGDLVALRGTVHTQTDSHVMWFVRLVNGKMHEMWTGSETIRS